MPKEMQPKMINVIFKSFSQKTREDGRLRYRDEMPLF